MHRDFRATNVCKIMSVIILFFFCWSFAGLRDMAYAATNPEILTPPVKNTPYAKAKGPASRHSEAVKSLKEALSQTKLSHKDKKARVKELRAEIKATDEAMRAEFKQTRARLVKKNLAPKILKRHDDFVARHKDKSARFDELLTDLDKARTSRGFKKTAAETLEFMKEHEPPSMHTPLDPDKLPHRAVEPTKLMPRTTPEEFLNLRAENGQWVDVNNKPILVASAGSLDGLLDAGEDYTLLAAGDPPTDADLTETIEVQFTEAIQAKASELGNDPLVIYEWVRNNVEYVPTYGSIQGADYCLQTLECNAFDTSSLLVALLRASGVHARYAYGSVEIPIERFTNWVGGFTNTIAALDFSATGGIPTRGLVEAGKLKVARIEQVWVEAWVDMIPSLGAKHVTGDTWVPLDASFKQYTYTEGMDISAEVSFDAEALVEDILASATINEEQGYVTGLDSSIINTAMTQYRAQVEEYMSTQQADATVGDVLGTKTIKEETQSILAGTLPYKLRAMGPRVSELPAELRHGIEFTMRPDEMNYEATHFEHFVSMPELAGKKVTISYAPATEADEAVINSYLPEPHPDGTPIDPSELPSSLPAYLINLKAELRIEGEVVATAGPYRMGTKQTTHMHFYDPVRGYESVSNCIYAGEYYGIAVSVTKVSRENATEIVNRLSAVKQELELSGIDNLTKDDVLGNILHSVAMMYNLRMDGIDTKIQRRTKTVAIRMPSVAIFKTYLVPESSFGVPVSASVDGLAMDVDRNMSMVKAYDGAKENKLAFMYMSGIASSSFEHMVPEEIFSEEGNPAEAVSAVKALKIANDAGIPIYRITSDNINTIIPKLQVDNVVIDEIKNAIASGNIVLIPETEITYEGWAGSGYIVFDTETGDGAFMISGGESGAKLIALGILTILIGALMLGSVALSPFGVLAILSGLKMVMDGLSMILETYYVDGDKCGPEGNKALSVLVPDSLFGMNFTAACAAHDACYATGGGIGDKTICDGLLGIDIASGSNSVSEFEAIVASSIFTVGVGFGGVFAFNWTELF